MTINDSNEGLVIEPVAFCEGLCGLDYQGSHLHIDGVSASTLAQTYGTPCYVYAKNAIIKAYEAYAQSFGELDYQICYAVKANSNLAVLKLLAQLGCGFDIVSKGELLRVLQVSDGKKVVYSGVGKTYDDIKTALMADIDCFNVEAVSELELINQVAGELGCVARISLRVNPDVDAKTHPYISTGLKDNKFGIDHRHAIAVYDYANTLPNLKIVGIDCHIGSQLLQTQPFVDALVKVANLVTHLAQKGIRLRHIDIGGGLGVRYIDENPASVGEYAHALMPILKQLGLKVYLEPGRNMVANAGVLLTSVHTLKPTDNKNFAIADASMSELIRPALYDAKMAVIPTYLNDVPPMQWDIVGSVCESADFLAKQRCLAIEAGDVLAITGAGAYGFVMASNYNTRPRPPEVMCDNGTHRLIRKRESYESLWADEYD